MAGDFHIKNYVNFINKYLNYFILYAKSSGDIRCIDLSDLHNHFF